MGLDESFLLSREPSYTDVFAEIVNRSKYARNRVSPFVNYDIGEKGEVRLAYLNEIFNYLQVTGAPRDNSTENRGILTLTYNFNSKNHLDLQNQVWQRTYDGDTTSDYTSYQAKLIYRREFSSYLQGQVGAGFQQRNFSDSALGDKTIPTFNIGLIGETERSRLGVSLERNFNDFTQYDNYYVAYLFRVEAEHTFLKAFRTFAGGYYQFSDFIDSSRRDNLWDVYGGLGYLFFDKKFEVSMEYNYKSRDSNEPGVDYGENSVLLTLTAHHDFGK